MSNRPTKHYRETISINVVRRFSNRKVQQATRLIKTEELFRGVPIVNVVNDLRATLDAAAKGKE